jgi:ATP-dependent DNA ligase
MNFQNTVVVNGQSITVDVEFGDNGGEIYTFPQLFKIDKLGRTSMWRIYVIGDEYFRESGIKGGKVKKYAAVKAIPKNVGKSNETTGESQAIFEAYSEWKHKKDQLYTEGETETEETGASEDADVGDRLRPMLAEKWDDRKKYAKFPGGVSPKLDGVRVMIYSKTVGSSKEIVMVSRLGKEYQHMNGIREEAKKIIDKFDVVLDGELYSHNIPFNAISGAVRSQSKPSKFDDVLEYHIFDLWIPSNPDMPYADRMELLRKIQFGTSTNKLQFVFYDQVSDEKEISQKHTEYVAQGYEGLIFRNLDGVYKLGRRVNDLLKYKEFEDEEFKVVDVMEGVGTESGAAVFVCINKDGTKFNVRPRGSIEKRRLQFKNKNTYIGKLLTVRYQPISREDVLPRFPVGIKFDSKTEEMVALTAVGFRDYE